jgi:nucleoside-diphosphate-sugar epimerase
MSEPSNTDTNMRIFLAGASGVIGIRLLPLLVDAGHTVAGMTRSPSKLAELEALGAEPVLCDVYDAEALTAAVVRFAPDAVMHQLTDLPDDATRIPELGGRNDRMRREGARNLLAAAKAAGTTRFYAQSIAWELPGERGVATHAFEQAVLDVGGVVVRYGQLYGAGTYFETRVPDPPRIGVDEAARRTMLVLDAAAGIVELVE